MPYLPQVAFVVRHFPNRSAGPGMVPRVGCTRRRGSWAPAQAASPSPVRAPDTAALPQLRGWRAARDRHTVGLVRLSQHTPKRDYRPQSPRSRETVHRSHLSCKSITVAPELQTAFPKDGVLEPDSKAHRVWQWVVSLPSMRTIIARLMKPIAIAARVWFLKTRSGESMVVLRMDMGLEQGDADVPGMASGTARKAPQALGSGFGTPRPAAPSSHSAAVRNPSTSADSLGPAVLADPADLADTVASMVALRT